MKKTIRRNVFETNSSSTHAICVPKACDISLPDTIYFHLDTYGWECCEYRDGADYLYTAIYSLYSTNTILNEEGNTYLDSIKQWVEECGSNVVFEIPTDTASWYIDHAEDARAFVEYVCKDKQSLLKFLSEGFVVTGNDNMYDEDNPAHYIVDEQFYDWNTKTYIPNPRCKLKKEDWIIFD